MGKIPVNNNFSKLKKNQKKDLIQYLENSYGCDLNFLLKKDFYINTKDKVYMCSVDPSNLDLKALNSIGLYFGTYHSNGNFRLSVEGSWFVNPSKNYLILKNKESLALYLSANSLYEENIEIENIEGIVPFIIVLHNNYSLGCVSKKEDYYLNYIPKSRKLDFNKVF